MPTSTELERGPEWQPQKRLFSFAFPKRVYPIPSKNERKQYPISEANPVSRFFFWWVLPVLNVGYTRTLTEQDLYEFNDDYRVAEANVRFARVYAEQVAKSKAKHIAAKRKENSSITDEEALADHRFHQVSMAKTLFLAFMGPYAGSILLCAFNATATGVTPLISKQMTVFVEKTLSGTKLPIGQGVGLAIGYSLLSFLGSAALYHFMYQGYVVGTACKAVLTHAILEKSFKLNAASRHKYPASKITSLMATDLSRVQMSIFTLPMVLVAPIPTIIAIVFLAVNLGVSALIGIVFFMTFLAATGWATTRIFRLRKVLSELTDVRVGITNEVINNLRMIKLYSWEAPYLSKILSSRSEEVKLLLKIQTLKNVFEAVAQCLSGTASMVTFIVLFYIHGSTKSAATTFSSLTAFDILTTALLMIPYAMYDSADLLMGLKRIALYLEAEEWVPSGRYYEYEDSDSQEAISINNASFEWELFEKETEEKEEEKEDKNKKNKKSKNKTKDQAKNKSVSQGKAKEDGDATLEVSTDSDNEKSVHSIKPKFSLQNINLHVRKGEFLIITGFIGSGKTSLLSAMSGTMPCTDGSISINGPLLFADQPWVQNSTIRENILFGSPLDKKRYDQVVYVCGLQADLDNLPAGDFTEVGERGITLSGGQKARINLARAVYANKDILLLDDVLSAVDAKVAKHIINHCFNDFLHGKTVVLATHQLSMVNPDSKIVFLNENNTIETGTTEDLTKTSSSFKSLLAYSLTSKKVEEAPQKNNIEEELETELIVEKTVQNDNMQVVRRKAASPSPAVADDEVFIDVNINKDQSQGRVIEDEDKAVNAVGFHVYKSYIKFGSNNKVILFLSSVFIMMALTGFLQVFGNTWLSFWIADKFTRPAKFYVGLYVTINVLWIVCIASLFIIVATGCATSSKNMNVVAVKNILHTPMAFLDVTPVGRILNRFTKDTDALDNEISEQWKYTLYAVYTLAATFILIIIYLPVVIAVVPFMTLAFVAMLNFYLSSTREIKRMESIKRSYLYNNFNESLTGQSTIKHYRVQQTFIDKSNFLMDEMNEATMLNYANQSWLSIGLESISVFFVLIVTLLCVTRAFKMNAASVGLLISYTTQLSAMSSFLIRSYSRLENEMNSVERVSEYATALPQEASYEIQATQPESSWPSRGEIEFHNVSMAYRPGLPNVLKNLSFTTAPGEKIGICGRTGAGKSSIMAALYRLTELGAGDIKIDGVDISKLGLKDLRSKLSVIPQDPVLFDGTIRKNLDPFNEHSDSKLWDALRRSGLVAENQLDIVIGQSSDNKDDLHKFHLLQKVEHGGSNFSLGEKQLIAFARALIRETRILIMDEATSSVDYETDHKIQRTIAQEFAHCTILCVAHRLKTIISYDRIMTLEKGEIEAMDTPWNLFNTEGSLFRQLCDKAGILEEDFTSK